jgi:hypothetical protein
MCLPYILRRKFKMLSSSSFIITGPSSSTILTASIAFVRSLRIAPPLKCLISRSCLYAGPRNSLEKMHDKKFTLVTRWPLTFFGVVKESQSRVARTVTLLAVDLLTSPA